MRRTATDKFREDLRLQQVYKTLLHYGMDTALEGGRFVGGVRHGMQTWVWRLPKDWESPPTAVKLRMMLEELGPTYVKIGQIVSSQASVLPPDWATELAKLQNAVPPFPAAQVRETIVEELGAPPEELYGSFEAEPFAAASTAQVHRATLHDGTGWRSRSSGPSSRRRSAPTSASCRLRRGWRRSAPRWCARSTSSACSSSSPRACSKSSTTAARSTTGSAWPRT